MKVSNKHSHRLTEIVGSIPDITFLIDQER